MDILDAAIAENKTGVLPGDVVFKLHDTYGFPADLTADVCRERGISVNTAEFDAAMERQRAAARASAKLRWLRAWITPCRHGLHGLRNPHRKRR